MLLGSGEPGEPGFEKATPVYNNIYHVPQYMPGYPTAAIIWPRVIEVPCRKVEAGLQCDGYNWTPNMGRAEYLYFMPVLAAVVPVSTAPEAAMVTPVAVVAPQSEPSKAKDSKAARQDRE